MKNPAHFWIACCVLIPMISMVKAQAPPPAKDGAYLDESLRSVAYPIESPIAS